MDELATIDSMNTIVCGDCVAGLNDLPKGSVDLVFADPPFNIGYEYDVYDDRRQCDHYLEWSREWIETVYRALSPSGAFWLAIGDEYAAELKLLSQDIGFHCRSWVIWYYTFGVNCKNKFSRSHAHLFHFVKDANEFTFRCDDLENRIPSARQLVYNDRRANSKGRLPDDTWMIRPADVVGAMTADELPANLDPPADDQQTWTLRPQDLAECFQADEDTWYFPRVAGTFKERAGFHGCQMPEQLLGRIIRTCSQSHDLVVDPFSGSATTLAVAKKLGRRFLGFELSDNYAQHGLQRLEQTLVGDPLDGSPEPLVSAPSTKSRRGRDSKAKNGNTRPHVRRSASESQRRCDAAVAVATYHGVREAFRQTHEGYSEDRVVADPQLNDRFVAACREAGLAGDTRTWNILLFRMRKRGELADLETSRRTMMTWDECDDYFFGSEIAWQSLIQDQAESLDEILCDPFLAAEFDATARRFAPGFDSLQYRWSALKIRKRASQAVARSSILALPSRLRRLALEDLKPETVPDASGVYLVCGKASKKLYVGETLNLRKRLCVHFESDESRACWTREFGAQSVQIFRTEAAPSQLLAWQCCFVRKHQPELNLKLDQLGSRSG